MKREVLKGETQYTRVKVLSLATVVSLEAEAGCCKSLVIIIALFVKLVKFLLSSKILRKEMTAGFQVIAEL